jgi:hypothetical protein
MMKTNKDVLSHFGCDVEEYVYSAYFFKSISLKDPKCDIKETSVVKQEARNLHHSGMWCRMTAPLVPSVSR